MKLNRIFARFYLISACFLAFLSSKAQIRLAVAGGIQSSNLNQKNSIPGFDTAVGKYYSSRSGFELGVLAEIPLTNKHLFIQPGIKFSAKGNEFEKFTDSSVYHSDTAYNQHTLNLNYIEIPVYLTWKLPLSKDGKNQFFISAGPYFAFVFGATQDYQNRILPYNSSKYLYKSGTEDLPVGNGTGAYKTFDFGLTAKAGFEFSSVLISAYYSQGLSNAYTAAYPSSFHNQVFGGSLGIWLNKLKPEPLPPADTDHDGTVDSDDSCMNIPGIPKYHGCPIPDSDHDGINDEIDSCIYQAGPARYHGCPIPDTDKDGIDDESDSCMTIAGTLKYHGCPVPDHDGDGVNDEEDKCPDQAGPKSNKGCPVINESIVRRAQYVAANVMFKTNSTKLTTGSYPAIRELADTMKTNPALSLLIQGHTDNMGTADYNMKLSIERANAVKKELLEMGVSGDRITVKGFGDTQPVADNNSPEGQAKNRRVVFVFQLKNR